MKHPSIITLFGVSLLLGNASAQSIGDGFVNFVR